LHNLRSFLDIVEPALAAAGFATARLDGKTPAKRRGELLRNFASGAQRDAAALSAVCSGVLKLVAGGVFAYRVDATGNVGAGAGEGKCGC